jgi:hypothetical protein
MKTGRTECASKKSEMNGYFCDRISRGTLAGYSLFSKEPFILEILTAM